VRSKPLFHGYSRIYMVIAAGVAWTMLAVLTADLLFTGLTSYHRYGEAGPAKATSQPRQFAATIAVRVGD